MAVIHTFSAPASSANLGPGFDCLALALDLANELVVEEGSGRLTIEGFGEDSLPLDETNLVARCFARAAPDAAGGWDLHCVNRVPPARGLGSSTAAAALGLMAGWTVTDQEWDADRLFEELAGIDGHPDNAAACAHGGVALVFTHPDAQELEALPLGALDWIAPLLVVPDRQVATTAARAVLPDSYEAATVTRGVGAVAALMTGLLSGDTGLLQDALHGDVLHERQRADLVPELDEIRESLANTRALGATMSGAGPAVLVWCEPDTRDQAEGTLAIDFPDSELLPLDVSSLGARQLP